jgi:hypothetical protein
MIEIEKGIPLPGERKHDHWALLHYPLDKMDVGDSISFAAGDEKALAKLRACAFGYGKARGKKFTVKKYDGRVRCWRIS